ncbi:MAG TPA: ATP-dependent sacrificial sulfur transferase LarE [Bacillota bacterium]|nr:ATP-dependent sacrificial sulfur transferase LarE [Bacillota bacterium]HOJ83998.1 ATP-dependent sacrificial sulfur transferase LarE [Bacillota bacterium]HOL16123.1 ATP-dependent sacrificial sulfur transferase LarE [Bacillota bacterium]HPZ11927.1 ATP-dependent sacrificial sulfur transferase LarE [Bacillota bacterium]HQE10172.1 ATP-dependent sacrificial sulfur transferase LarE [Bacillota bacterium]
MFRHLFTGAALRKKEKRLEYLLSGCRGALIAFSGGVDSAFLLYKAAAALGRNNILAVTAVSPIRTASEIKAAGELAAALGIPHRLIHTAELSSPLFLENGPDRCYHCKKTLFASLAAIAAKESRNCILDGSNYDDLADYRPGAAAACEFGVRSPLQEAALAKKEIRILSRRCRLPVWNRPAQSCLATRFPYGEKIELEKLKRVEEAESFLRSLGLRREIRVRCHGRSARIEVCPADFARVIKKRAAVGSYFKKIGFRHVSLDLEGYASGILNRSLTDNRPE